MRAFWFILLGMLVFAAAFRIDFYFSIVYLFVLIGLIGLGWRRRGQDHLTASRRFVKRAFPNDRVHVELTVKNGDWLPILGLEIEERTPAGITPARTTQAAFALPGHGSKTVRYDFRATQRGVYKVGSLHVRWLSLFSGRHIEDRPLADDALIIYPKVVPLKQLGLRAYAPHIALASHQSMFDDPTYVTGLRPYQPGDPQRSIHWTATAHSGDLMVKQYKPTISRETLICLDMGRANYMSRYLIAAGELAITATASIAHHIIKAEGLPVGLLTHAPIYGAKSVEEVWFPPHLGSDYLMLLLETLAPIGLMDDIDFEESLMQTGARLSWGTTMVIITGKPRESLDKAMLQLRQMGVTVVLILVHGSNERPDQVPMPGVDIYRLTTEKDLEATL